MCEFLLIDSPFLLTIVLFKNRIRFPGFFDGFLKRFGSPERMELEATPRELPYGEVPHARAAMGISPQRVPTVAPGLFFCLGAAQNGGFPLGFPAKKGGPLKKDRTPTGGNHDHKGQDILCDKGRNHSGKLVGEVLQKKVKSELDPLF